ncbi:MAG: hydroxyethylthiazole kinase [Clostridiaceae bacterium]
MENIKKYLGRIKETKKVIHCITNSVTVNDVANVILATGASPIMADSSLEAEEVTRIAGALLINLGMPSEDKVKAMISSGKAATESGIPIVFDPVGAGISKLRNESSLEILKDISPTVLRGNFDELSYLVDGISNTNGIDFKENGIKVTQKDMKDLAERAAQKFKCIVVLTGTTDYITDGLKTDSVDKGSRLLRSITGSGDMLDGIIAAFLSSAEDNLLEAVTAAVTLMGIAGEKAEAEVKAQDKGIGSFRTILLDEIWKINN